MSLNVTKKILAYHTREIETYKRLPAKHIAKAQIFVCHNRNAVITNGQNAEIAFLPYDFPQDLIKAMPNLKWIQVMAAGVEYFVSNADQFKDIIVTRMVGVDANYMAEYVLAYFLYFSQNIDQILAAQKEKNGSLLSLPLYIGRLAA